jgi:hypothetical protein
VDFIRHLVDPPRKSSLTEKYLHLRGIPPVPVAVRSKTRVSCTISLKAAVLPGLISGRALVKKTRVCGRSPAETVGSNPAGSMDVFLLW